MTCVLGYIINLLAAMDDILVKDRSVRVNGTFEHFNLINIQILEFVWHIL